MQIEQYDQYYCRRQNNELNKKTDHHHQVYRNPTPFDPMPTLTYLKIPHRILHNGGEHSNLGFPTLLFPNSN